ncbi:M23 family metallopeptidase [Microbacterium thalli]|uniref:M23 family metallopeptidase n=1 Tax=Microbacterium thalli TaxID=3027921 RepID=A0ABT5SKF0_9MICO|nr:M23 family metallopeptidase [Microbacterium thalli]MDD7963299.1 M23 family metallopeptidase [Microbacterium thalli]
MTLETFWSEERWGREYGWRPEPGEPNPYDLGYHIAQDIMGGSWFGPVPVLRPGVIVQTGRSSKIGGFVTIRADDDGFHDTYCHLNTSDMPAKQTRVKAGDELPELARSAWIGAGHDYMGSASTGPHCHFTVTRTIDGAYNPRRGNDIDPRPIILAALSGQAAASTARPFVPEEDEDMARLIKFDDGILPNNPTFLVAPGYLYCHADAQEQRVDKYLYGTTIKALNADDFYRALKTHGLHGAAGRWGTPPAEWSLPKPGIAYLEAPGSKG